MRKLAIIHNRNLKTKYWITLLTEKGKYFYKVESDYDLIEKGYLTRNALHKDFGECLQWLIKNYSEMDSTIYIC